jgi:non-ribosomal peptide synthetase-like protein
MQTTSSLLRLRARTDVASPVAPSLAAFAVLVFRYARCPAISFVANGRALRVSMTSSTTLADLLASLPPRDDLASLVGPRGDLSMTWSEDDARLSLTVRLSDLTVIADTSFQRGLVATHDPLRDVRRHFRAAIACLRLDRSIAVGAVPLLDADERRFVLDVLGRGESIPELLSPGTLVGLFEARARRTPNAIAIEDGARSTTYGELLLHARDLASALSAAGIGRGAHVALVMPRCIEAYVAMLGVLRAGAGYVPIDPSSPPERTAHVLRDCACRAVLTLEPLVARIDAPCPVVTLDARTPIALGDDTLAEVRAPHPDDVAYVIYTSGSTGTPKGVAVTHRSARHLVLAEQRLFAPRESDRVLQGFSLAFDAAVEEIWLAFASGATLVVADDETLRGDLATTIADRGITVFSCVPTLLSMIEGTLPGVRILVVGGEECPPEIVRRFATRARPLFNTYGPTEATVIATCARLDGSTRVTIGRPIANTAAYVLDPDLRPVPVGVAGEICLGGVGLARGYVGAPLLTASKFVPNPAADRVGAPARIYRTGDRGRFTPEGEIEFLGRLDEQVKLRGFRIELREIENALLACDGVAQAAAMVRRDETTGVEGIVAYVVPRMTSDVRTVDEDALRTRLRKRLPPYMMPTHVEPLDRLPTLPSGKIDKRSLPPPRPRTPTRAIVTPRSDDVESCVRATFASLLGVGDVAADAHFFDDLGGHSLLATRVVSQLRRDARFTRLSVLDLYRHPTAAALAMRMRAMTSAIQTTRPTKIERSILFVVAQAIASLFVFGVHAWQWLGPFVVFVAARAHGATLVVAAIRSSIALFATPPATLALVIAMKWIVIGRYREGRCALGSFAYLRAWLVDRLIALAPLDALAGAPWMNVFLRAMGARVGRNVHIATSSLGAFDLVELGDDVTLGTDATVAPASIENGALVLAPVRIGVRCTVGTRAHVRGGATMRDDATLAPLSILSRGDRLAPRAPDLVAIVRPTRARSITLFIAYALAILALPSITTIAIAPALGVLTLAERWLGGAYLSASPIAAISFVVALLLEVVVLQRCLLGRVRPGRHAVSSGFAFRKWIVDRARNATLDTLASIYGTLWIVPWLRALGLRVGARAEMSTATDFVPGLVHVGAGAFVADCVSLGAPTIDRGTITLERTTIGVRAFVGNSAVVPNGATLADDALVACMSLAPARSSRGASFLGAPPTPLPRRAPCASHAIETTLRPRRTLVAQRLTIELARAILPSTIWIALTCLVVSAWSAIERATSTLVALASLPVLAALAGAFAAAIVVALKWIVVGRVRPGTHPLWSPFVWRTELVTALHEDVVDPLWTVMLLGTPFAPWFFRALGAKIGRRVHLGTTQMTEYDLVEIADDACLDEDCTLQTHLFEDRVMKTSRVRVGEGCSVGRDAIVLYDGEIGAGATLGPMSLAMKGETLPAGTRWRGIPATPES